MTTNPAPQTPSAAPVFVEGFCAPAARPFVLVAAILASALGFIDGTVVAIAMPAIRTSLGASLEAAQWVHNAYMLTLSALILVGGAMGDRFGLARVFGGGIVLFVLASVVCALAPDSTFLILARLVQGVGAAIMVPGSLAIIARAYPRESRGRAIGIWAAASALTTALGPIIGGLVLSFGGPEMWRWIFAVNLPLGALALFLLWSRVGSDRANRDAPIDVPGAALATAALFCIAWGLTAGSHGGGSTLGLWLGAGAVLLLTFVVVEHRQTHPMMPLSLFANRVFSAANVLSFTLYSALNIMLFFLPMTLIAGWGYAETWAALAFAPLSVLISALSGRVGRLADRYGPGPLLTLGSVLVAAGYGLMAFTAPLQDLWRGILPAMSLVGLGMAMVVAPLSTAVMGAVTEAQSGVASGVNNAVTRLAGLISVAAVGGLIAARYAGAGGTASFGVMSDSAGHAAAMTAAFATLGWLAAGLSALSALIAAVFLRR